MRVSGARFAGAELYFEDVERARRFYTEGSQVSILPPEGKRR
jgi:hypothetical protein